MKEIIYSIFVILVFYGLGGIATAMSLSLLWPSLYPWIGILGAIVYAVIMTVVMTWAASFNQLGGNTDANRKL